MFDYKIIRMSQEILYPVFIDISTQIDDGFWKSILVDLGYGICPKGSFISKGNLCCYKKTEKILYNIESFTLNIDDVVLFLKQNTSLRSQKEKSKVLEELRKYNNMKDIPSWTSIKKKSLKDVLIERYILSIRKIYNLNYEEISSIKSDILIAIAFKHIKPTDIIIKDGEISEINGVVFSDDGIVSITNLNMKV
jgi:hypothetical protein